MNSIIFLRLALTVINRNSGQQAALQDSSMSSQLTRIRMDYGLSLLLKVHHLISLLVELVISIEMHQLNYCFFIQNLKT